MLPKKSPRSVDTSQSEANNSPENSPKNKQLLVGVALVASLVALALSQSDQSPVQVSQPRVSKAKSNPVVPGLETRHSVASYKNSIKHIKGLRVKPILRDTEESQLKAGIVENIEEFADQILEKTRSVLITKGQFFIDNGYLSKAEVAEILQAAESQLEKHRSKINTIDDLRKLALNARNIIGGFLVIDDEHLDQFGNTANLPNRHAPIGYWGYEQEGLRGAYLADGLLEDQYKANTLERNYQTDKTSLDRVINKLKGQGTLELRSFNKQRTGPTVLVVPSTHEPRNSVRIDNYHALSSIVGDITVFGTEGGQGLGNISPEGRPSSIEERKAKVEQLLANADIGDERFFAFAAVAIEYTYLDEADLFGFDRRSIMKITLEEGMKDPNWHRSFLDNLQRIKSSPTPNMEELIKFGRQGIHTSSSNVSLSARYRDWIWAQSYRDYILNYIEPGGSNIFVINCGIAHTDGAMQSAKVVGFGSGVVFLNNSFYDPKLLDEMLDYHQGAHE